MAKKSSFALTLKVGHPELSAEEIASAFDLETSKMQSVGQPRVTPKGRRLEGNFRHTNINFHLSNEQLYFDEFDIEEQIWKFLDCFEHSYLAGLVANGGWSSFFIGVFTEENIEFVVSCELMEALARAKISLWYDVYGPDD